MSRHGTTFRIYSAIVFACVS